MELTQTGSFVLERPPPAARGRHEGELPAFTSHVLTPAQKDRQALALAEAAVHKADADVRAASEDGGGSGSTDALRLGKAQRALAAALEAARVERKKFAVAAPLRKPAIFCGASDGTVVSWFVEDVKRNDKPWAHFTAHSAGVTCIAHLSDYDLLLTGCVDGTLRVWDPWASGGVGGGGVELARERPVQTLVAHTASVVACTYLPDIVFSASVDHYVRVWRRDDGREMLRYPWFHCSQMIRIGGGVDVWPAALGSMAVHSKMLDRLFIGCADGEIFMFEAPSVDEKVDSLLASDGAVNFQPVSIGAKQAGGPPRVGRVVGKLGIRSLRVLPADNILLVVSNDHACRVLDLDTMAVSLSISDTVAKYTAACFLTAQQEVVLVDQLGGAHVWNTFSGKQVGSARLAPRQRGRASGQSAAADVGPLITGQPADSACQRVLVVMHDHVQCWSMLREEKLVSYEGHEGAVLDLVAVEESWHDEAPQYEAVALDVSAHHRIYSVGRDDHRIRCWDPYDNSCLRIYQGCEGASCFLYSQPHARLVTGHEDGTVRLWNPDAGSCVRLLPVGGQHGALPWGSTRQRQLENMISCCTLGRLQKGGRERQLLTGDYDGMVGIFDLRKDRDAEPHLKAIHSCHEGEILAMAFNPANGLVYTAGNELIIRAWDETKVAAREREWRPAAELHGHEDSIACLCVGGEPESGSALLFSGSDNGEVVMWDTVEHVEVARFTVDKGRDQAVLLKRGYSPEAIRQLITVPSAQLLVAVVTDGTLLLWDIPSRTLRRHFRQNHVEIRCVAHRPAAAQLLLGTEEGSIEVFPLSSLCSHGEDLRLPLPEPKPEPEPEPEPEPDHQMRTQTEHMD